MPNGKVLIFGRDNAERIWDPITQAITIPPHVGYDLFCAGHTLLPDGRVLIAGGHLADFVGLAKTSIYNPATNSWTTVPDMNAGRWYPTLTTLPNGDVLVVSGQIDTSIGVNPLPQVYQTATNTWRNLTGAQLNQGLYPMMFLAPNGKVIDVAPTHVTRWLDTAGTGTWSLVGFRNFGWRDYGTAAMYADGKILVTGGASNPPTASAEVIDLNAATPSWRSVAPMNIRRRHLNSTLLPDGTVLVTGGTSGFGHNNASTAVFAAELWNPATETWTMLASASVPRLYHSSAMLLPDGRVMTNGGDGITDVEVFSPPYLFKGARPTMSGVPASIGWGQQFTVQSPDAANIGKVTLIRLGSPTHAFDMNQRLNVLQFTRAAGTVSITTPPNANLAPPGHYMLFIVNGNGVPSVGSIVQISGTAPPRPPPPAGGTGTACGPYPDWNSNTRYVGGESVTRLGKNYIAKVVGASVWNVNSAPEWTPSYWGPTTCP
jgi:WD40 repeat protein